MFQSRLNREKFVAYLGRKNLTQGEAARKLGLSEPFLSQLIWGKRRPSPRARKRFLEYLGGEFDDWFDVESDSSGSVEGSRP